MKIKSEVKDKKIEALARIQLNADAYGGEYVTLLDKAIINLSKESGIPASQIKDVVVIRALEIG